jgi:hypothetical protein
MTDPDKMKVFIAPPKFPGQEDVECWCVMHADSVGQDEGFEDFMAVVRDSTLGEVWIAAENLTRDAASIHAAELTLDFPERKYFVMPIRFGKLS